MNKNNQIKKEVLRYLGHKGQKIDSTTNRLIEDAINEMENLIKERYIYNFFNISRKKDGLYLNNSNLYLKGEDIKNHLSKSRKCVFIAATLGHYVDTKIRYYENVDMEKALIFDACATAFIEDICDRICEEIEEKLKKEDKKLTSRFSPGYGDLSINIQRDFLSILNAPKAIGLNVSSESILIPRKSVTAITGIIDINENIQEKNCINCNKYLTCRFSKGGNSCGY